MAFFLLVFDRSTGHLVEEVAEFQDGTEALGARFKREQIEIHNPAIEVVVLGAADKDALFRTHSRYFGTRELTDV